MIKGQNLRVLVDSKCIAMATSCTVHIGTQTEDATTKDSTGDWNEIDIVGKSFDVRTSSLVLLQDNGSNGETTAALELLILNSTKVTLTFDTTAGTNNRTPQNSALKLSGDAFLTNFTLNAPNRQNSTADCEFTGTGPLAKAS